MAALSLGAIADKRRDDVDDERRLAQREEPVRRRRVDEARGAPHGRPKTIMLMAENMVARRRLADQSRQSVGAGTLIQYAGRRAVAHEDVEPVLCERRQRCPELVQHVVALERSVRRSRAVGVRVGRHEDGMPSISNPLVRDEGDAAPEQFGDARPR